MFSEAYWYIISEKSIATVQSYFDIEEFKGYIALLDKEILAINL